MLQSILTPAEDRRADAEPVSLLAAIEQSGGLRRPSLSRISKPPSGTRYTQACRKLTALPDREISSPRTGDRYLPGSIDKAAHSGSEFGGIEGLDDVVGGSVSEAAHDIFFLPPAGKQDDGHVAGVRVLPHAHQDVKPVHAGHVDV